MLGATWHFIKRLHFHTVKFSLEKNKLETQNTGLSCWVPDGFSTRMFKHSTNSIQFLFSGNSGFFPLLSLFFFFGLVIKLELGLNIHPMTTTTTDHIFQHLM
jgi:hypothetical protein